MSDKLTTGQKVVVIICTVIAMCFVDTDDIENVFPFLFIVPFVSLFIHWLIVTTWEHIERKIDEDIR